LAFDLNDSDASLSYEETLHLSQSTQNLLSIGSSPWDSNELLHVASSKSCQGLYSCESFIALLHSDSSVSIKATKQLFEMNCEQDTWTTVEAPEGVRFVAISGCPSSFALLTTDGVVYVRGATPTLTGLGSKGKLRVMYRNAENPAVQAFYSTEGLLVVAKDGTILVAREEASDSVPEPEKQRGLFKDAAVMNKQPSRSL
jgi:hypothetical protein